MRQGHRKGKGQRAVKVLDQRPETSFSAKRCCPSDSKLISVQKSKNPRCFWSKGQLPAQDYSLQSTMVPLVFTNQQERKWNMHVFTEPNTQAKMDDNSSIVALSHILDRHIMRPRYCFPLLLWSCLNTKFILKQTCFILKGQGLIGCEKAISEYRNVTQEGFRGNLLKSILWTVWCTFRNM